MLKFCAIFLIFAGFLEIGRSEESRETCLSAHEACNDLGMNLFLPGTEEELARFCRTVDSLMECVINYKRQCQPESPLIPRMENMLSSIREFCRPSTLSYEVVVEQIGCIQREIKEHNIQCDPAVYDGIESALAEMKEDLDKMNENDRYSCVHGLRKLFCLLEKIAMECRSGTAATLFDIAKKVEFPFHCPREIVANLPGILSTVIDHLKKEVESSNKNLIDIFFDRM